MHDQMFRQSVSPRAGAGRPPFARGGVSPRAFGLLLALALLLAGIALAPRPASADGDGFGSADVSGRYEGVQFGLSVVATDVAPDLAESDEDNDLREVGVPFILSLTQSGALLSGTLQQSGSSDDVHGVVSGEQIFLVHEAPTRQYWIGEAGRDELGGRWFNLHGGAGSWEAERIDRRTEFEVEFGVEPDAIAAGHESRVVYTLDVFNVGDHAAVGAHASFAALPPFFHPAQILIGPLDAALDGDAATDGANVPTLEIPLGTIEPGAAVRVQLIGSATPEREGRFTSIASVAAENAERAMARTVLEVEGSSLTAASAFVPSTVTSGGDRRVIYIVSLEGSALSNGVVFVKSSPLGELLRERTTFVFGALWEGSLTEGMEIFGATTDFGLVQIIVTGTVGSLDAGHYETTVVAEGGGARAESTAGLRVVARDDDRDFESEPSERDFDDDDQFDDDDFDEDEFDDEEPEHELFEERDEDDEGEEEDEERDGPAPLLDVAHALEELQAEISEFFGGDLRQRLIELVEEARVAADKGNADATWENTQALIAELEEVSHEAPDRIGGMIEEAEQIIRILDG